MKKRKPMKRFVDHYLSDLTAMANTLSADFQVLQRRLALWSRDGYPSGLTGTVAGGAISDPTATAVLSPDPVRKDRERLSELVVKAHEILGEADSIRSKYMTTATQAQRHNQGLAKCANQYGCPDDAWASKAGRCSTCYEYRRRHQGDRPPKRS